MDCVSEIVSNAASSLFRHKNRAKWNEYLAIRRDSGDIVEQYLSKEPDVAVVACRLEFSDYTEQCDISEFVEELQKARDRIPGSFTRELGVFYEGAHTVYRYLVTDLSDSEVVAIFRGIESELERRIQGYIAPSKYELDI